MNVFNVNILYFILPMYINRGRYMSNFRSKGQRSISQRLSWCTYFLTGCLKTSCSVFLSTFFVHRFRIIKKYAKKVLGQLSFVKVSKGPCPMRLKICRFLCIVSVRAIRISVLWSIFDDVSLFFNIPSWPYWVFFTLILPGSRDIMQNRPAKVSLHLTGLTFGIWSQNIAHNFYKMQKGKVTALYKIIQ